MARLQIIRQDTANESRVWPYDETLEMGLGGWGTVGNVANPWRPMKSRAFARRVDGLGRRLSTVRRPECWDVNEPGVTFMDWAFGCGKAPMRCCTGRSMGDFRVEDAPWGAGWRKGGMRHRRARFLSRCHCIGAADGAGVSTCLRRLQRGWPLPGIVNCVRTSWSGSLTGCP